MADMCASVVKGMKFSVIAPDYQHAHGQSAVLQPQSASRLFKFRCPFKVNHNLAVAETPTLGIGRFRSGRHAENTLQEIAIQEFDGHDLTPLHSSG
jgi:hypothetical protein